MKLISVVIDDEKANRELLSHMVADSCERIQIVASVPSVREGVLAINKHKPHLVFLDVEMPDMNGFSLFEYFDRPDFKVVFVTAHEHYAMNAIKNNAFDYLLKPINVQELIRVQQRLVREWDYVTRSFKLNDEYIKKFDELHRNLSAVQQKEDLKLYLPTLGGFKILDHSSIQYIEAKGSYSNLRLVNGSDILVTKSIGEFESELGDLSFFRCHKSFMVNLDLVEEYNQHDGGQCITKQGSIVPVARRKYSGFLTRIMKKSGLVDTFS